MCVHVNQKGKKKKTFRGSIDENFGGGNVRMQARVVTVPNIKRGLVADLVGCTAGQVAPVAKAA